MAHRRRPAKPVDPLEKPIPRNPKFDGVHAVVNSGASITRLLERMEEERVNMKKSRDEIFKRIKATTLGKLLHAYEDKLLEREAELEKAAEMEETSSQLPECEFLLLDIREREEYDACHIRQALSYPHTMLSRSVNYFTTEIFQYKNKDGRSIILYDAEEKQVLSSGTVFVQKGVDNVYILNGGMKEFLVRGGEHLVVGNIPASLAPPPPPRGSTAHSMGGEARKREEGSSSSRATQSCDSRIGRPSTRTADQSSMTNNRPPASLHPLPRRGTNSNLSTVSRISHRSTVSKTAPKPWKP